MGMFDIVIVEFPLPCFPTHLKQSEIEWQTKSLDCLLTNYKITKDGELFEELTDWKDVEEENRPFYGTPQWSNPFAQICGSISKIPLGWQKLDYSGKVEFHSGKINKRWYNYIAVFEKGNLIEIFLET